LDAGVSERIPTPRLVGMMAGLWIWAIQFTLVYGFTALACARDFADWTVAGFNIVRLVIAVVTLICLVLDAAVMLKGLRVRRSAQTEGGATSGDAMIGYITVTVAALSLIAIAYTGLPALIVPVCG
jgi:hypothetical protein